MEFDFSRDSVAFSDIAPPSHVSELESFSDLELSDTSSVEFAGIAIRNIGESPEGRAGEEDKHGRRNSATESNENQDRMPSALQDLNSGSVMECLAARKDLMQKGKLVNTGHEQSSLDLLQMDSLRGSDMFELMQTQAENPLLSRTPIGDEKPPAQVSHVSDRDSGDPCVAALGSDSQAGHSVVLPGDRGIPKEKRPDTGQVPDDFFNRPVASSNGGYLNDLANGEAALGQSFGAGSELNFLLLGRSGSGDGGELFDPMSLSSSISLIQSQTFPSESLLSLSSASRGLGSGMDSRPCSTNGDDGAPLDDQHAMSPDSNDEDRGGGLARRPGLEGANSDPEDISLPQNLLVPSTQSHATGTVRELRQSAEGEVVVPDVPGDGGGGGDGSSGHSSDDDRGPAGAAYVSSGSNTAPSIPVPTSTVSALLRMGVAVQEPLVGPAAGPSSPSGNRGHPVGGAIVGGWTGAVAAPSSSMADSFADQSRASFMNSGHFEFQVSSTPMVKVTKRDSDEEGSIASESSGLRSCYLLAAGPANGVATHGPRAPLTQDSTFHLSQLLAGDQSDHTLGELPSLSCESTAAAAPASTSQQTDSGGTRHRPSGPSRLEAHGRAPERSPASQPDASDVSLGLPNSALAPNASGAEGDSQLWKSTPREGEEGIRATPGIIFNGDPRPSPVTGGHESDQASQSTAPESANNSVIEVPKDGSTLTADDAVKVNDVSGRVAKVQEYLSKLSVDNVPFERTLTPGGLPGDPSARWPSYPFTPSPFAAQGSQESQGQFSQVPNPFDGEDGEFDWTGAEEQQIDFISQSGNAADILDADQKRFEEEQLESPPVETRSCREPDWTPPDESKMYVRASLMEMFGNSTIQEESRVSLGRFLAAGSEELGSLSNKDPNRPRPQFGESRQIITPPRRTPPRMVPDSFMSVSEPILGDNSPQEKHDESLSLDDLQPEGDDKEKGTKATVASGIRKGSVDTSAGQRVASARSSGVPDSSDVRGDQDQRKSQENGGPRETKAQKERKGSRDSTHSSSSERNRKNWINQQEKPVYRSGRDRSAGSTSEEMERRDRKSSNDSRKTSADRRAHRSDTETTPESRKASFPPAESKLGRVSEIAVDPDHRILTPTDVSVNPLTSSTISDVLSPPFSGEPSTSDVLQLSPQDTVGFIARAIKVDPNDLRWLIKVTKSRAAQKRSKGGSSASTDGTSRGEKQHETGAGHPKLKEKARSSERSAAEDVSMVAPHPAESSNATMLASSPDEVLAPHKAMPDPLADYALSPPIATASAAASGSLVESPELPESTHEGYDESTISEGAANERSADLSVKYTRPASPPHNPFDVHIIPAFGETYTVSKTRRQVITRGRSAAQDPLKRRRSEIEDRLDKSVSPVKVADSPQEGGGLDVSSRVEDQSGWSESFDSAVGNLSSHRTFEDSFPKTAEISFDTPNLEGTSHKSTPPGRALSTTVGSYVAPVVDRQRALLKGAADVHHGQGPADVHPSLVPLPALQVHAPSSVHFPFRAPIQGLQAGYAHGMDALGMGPSPFAPAPLGFRFQGAHMNGWGAHAAPLAGAGNPFQGFGVMQGQQPSVTTVSAAAGPIPATLNPAFTQLPVPLEAGMAPHAAPYGGVGAAHGSGPSLPFAPVIVPGEVKLPPTCCVGVSTQTVLPLHNSSSRWMQCAVGVVACAIDGKQIYGSGEGPFAVQAKVIIAPHTTDNITVKFEPKQEGAYTAKFQIVSSVVVKDYQPGSQNGNSFQCTVSIEVLAEKPNVEILAEDSRVIDFGEMVGGSKQSRPLRLINRGTAPVPVRIILSAATASSHCFSFAKADSSPTMDKAPFSVRAGPGMALSIQTLTLPGRSDMNTKVEPTVVWLLFQAPHTEPDESGQVGSPEEYSCHVDVEIESPGQGPTVGSILAKALVGVVSLRIPRNALKVLTLEGAPGQKVNITLPLRNAGNIPFQVLLKLRENPEHFTVSPTRFRLTPGQEHCVNVHFRCGEPTSVIDSSLTMTVLPNGPAYEVMLQGLTREATKDDSAFLLCNKSVVCWGGVRIGKSSQQKLVLKNKSTSPTKKLKLRLSIQGNHSDFQVQNLIGNMAEEPQSAVVTLGPQEVLPIHLLFAPSSIGLISSCLVATSGATVRSKVPLYGCGGTSEIVVLDTQQVNKGYAASIGEVSLGRKHTMKLTLRNSGTRAAFVKMICYSDPEAFAVYPSTHMTVTPDCFVLPERTSKHVQVSYQPLERDALRCRAKKSTVATLAIYSGDETIRRQYREYVKKSGASYSETCAEGFLTGANLLKGFDEKERVIEVVSYPHVPNWDSFFQSQVRKVLVFLVGSPPKPAMDSTNKSLDVVPMPLNKKEKHSASPTLAPNTSRQGPKARTEEEPETWDIIPNHLVLSSPRTRDGTRRLQLINFSERDLRFEIVLPAHCLVVTPDRGNLPSRSKVVVIMSTRPDLKGLELPWGGTVYVHCDQTTKSIRVQIREDIVMDHSPYLADSAALKSLATNNGPATPQRQPDPRGSSAPIRVRPKTIEFSETRVGKVSVMEITVQNTTSFPQKWILSSLAPAYVKDTEDSGSILRTTYAAFSFPSQSGALKSGETKKAKQDNPKRDVKVRVAVTGPGIKQLPTTDAKGKAGIPDIVCHTDAAPPKSKQVKINSNPAVPLPSGGEGKHGSEKFYITNNMLEFPETLVGETSEIKVKVCNESSNIYKVKVADPQSPFFPMRHEFVVNPGRFTLFPVKFKPTRPRETFTSMLVLTAADISISVYLKGRSALNIDSGAHRSKRT